MIVQFCFVGAAGAGSKEDALYLYVRGRHWTVLMDQVGIEERMLNIRKQ